MRYSPSWDICLVQLERFVNLCGRRVHSSVVHGQCDRGVVTAATALTLRLNSMDRVDHVGTLQSSAAWRVAEGLETMRSRSHLGGRTQRSRCIDSMAAWKCDA